MREPSQQWQRYGRAVIRSMGEVLEEVPEDLHGPMLETADYWLSVGLAFGLSRPAEAERLLALILAHEDEGSRAELEKDGAHLCAEVFE